MAKVELVVSLAGQPEIPVVNQLHAAKLDQLGSLEVLIGLHYV